MNVLNYMIIKKGDGAKENSIFIGFENSNKIGK